MRPLPASLFHENDELYVGVFAVPVPNEIVGQVKRESSADHRTALCVGRGDGEDGGCGNLAKVADS